MRLVEGLDHLVFLIRDLENGAEELRRLGFRVSARGEHDLLQTSNYTIIFERDYLELMTVRSPCSENRPIADLLAKREGLGYIVFSTADAAKLHSSLEIAGIRASGPTDFSREVTRPEGKFDARFRIVRVTPEDAAGLHYFYCQHFTPQLVWLPELLSHNNSAYGIRCVVIVVRSLKEQVNSLLMNIGGTLNMSVIGRAELKLANTTLIIQETESFAEEYGLDSAALARLTPFYGAVTFNVYDLDHTRSFLVQNGVCFQDYGESIRLNMWGKLGVTLTFDQGDRAS